MLYYETVSPSTLELLKKIQQENIFRDLVLVGGTALALQYGHRLSIDLDFFGTLNSEKLEVDKTLSGIGELKKIHNTPNINIYTLDDIKIDIVNYHYPWINKINNIEGLRLASIEDIAAMKLSAITGRGSKKDFIDLFFILKNYSLKQIISFYEEKFSDGSVFMVLKSLSYFDDAEEDVMPVMLRDIEWNEVKKGIISELKKI